MTSAIMKVGLGATKSTWSAQLRTYCRDHMTAMAAEMVLEAGQLNGDGQRHFDVVIIDDTTRIFAPADVGALVTSGTVVIGLFDDELGLGQAHLERLGVSRLLPASTPTDQLAEMIAEIGPINATEVAPQQPPGPQRRAMPPGRRGLLTVLSAASGGCGLTEALVGLAQAATTRPQRLLVIEANPLRASLATRLRRPTGYGLTRPLSLIAQGRPGLPDGLTPTWTDAGAALGRFDLICQTAAPGGPPMTAPGHLNSLVDEGLAGYDHVLVDAGPLLGSSAGQSIDRFAATRAVLGRADQVMVFASADPEGAVHLAEWLASAQTLNVTAPAWAVFGRTPASLLKGTFEQARLTEAVEANTGRGSRGFAAVRFLPEDAVVARARWNGEIVWRGRWLGAVGEMTAELVAPPTPVGVRAAVRSGRRVNLAGGARW
jgi:Mrp family chromosome partitioning ATPase